MTPEQLLAAYKANLQTLFGLSAKSLEGFEKLTSLHVQIAKASLDEVAAHTVAALSVKDAQELVALNTNLLQPSAERAAAYNRAVYDIVSATNADIARVNEETARDTQKKISSAIDSALKNAPAGTENAAALVKSAVAAANGAYESAQKALKQAIDVAEANAQAFTTTAIKQSQTVAKGRRTAA